MNGKVRAYWLATTPSEEMSRMRREGEVMACAECGILIDADLPVVRRSPDGSMVRLAYRSPYPELCHDCAYQILVEGGWMATKSKYRAAGVADVFRAIAAERRYMNETVGRIEDNPFSLEEWLGLMEEGLGAAYRAYLDKNEPLALAKVLQVVATGIATLEQHGVFERGDVDDDGEFDRAGADRVYDLASSD
ncbi:MAG: hypothetical protein JXQ75_12040 [Phycisphaerae bacterium]|nr:hypothetical protein [Phycisphaerae bacterium]